MYPLVERVLLGIRTTLEVDQHRHRMERAAGFEPSVEVGMNPYCSAATACSEPGACQSSVDAGQLVALVAIVVLPVAGVLLPLLLASTTASAGPDVAHHHSLPVASSVASSGMLVVLVCLVLGYSPTFFMLLTSQHPCTTAIGGCASISCACGNYYEYGYTWMAVVLITCSMLLVRDFASLPDGRLKRMLLAGALCVMTPGVMPERFETESSQPVRFLNLAYAMHLIGLALSMLLLMVLPFAVVCSRAARRLGRRACRCVLGVRGAHAGAAAGFALAFLALKGQADVSDYCAAFAADAVSAGQGQPGQPSPLIAAALACDAWPALPAADCAALASLRSTGGHPVPATYRCGWINGSLSALDRLLLPSDYVPIHDGLCRKARCKLYANARSMALEFAMLWAMGSYVALYTRGDMEWVASEPPAEELQAAARLVEPHTVVPIDSADHHALRLNTRC